MLKLWKWYRNCLTIHPLKTQLISFGFLWGMGDVLAQTISCSTLRKQPPSPGGSTAISDYAPVANAITVGVKRDHVHFVQGSTCGESEDGVKELKINWRRVAITSMFGFAFVGPVGHFWYQLLDRLIRLRLRLQPKPF